jgi:hypothetical protein
MSALNDKELNQYRDLIKPPGYFDEGFSWKSLLGALFVGLVMLPASMYMGLAIGEGIGPAAQWVTVILFLEMAKRARSTLKPAELFILFAMVGTLVGSPMQGLFWNQFLVQSEAARGFGLSDSFPAWFVPSDPAVLDQRSFLMWEWFLPLMLVLVGQISGRIDSLVLGYGLFRIASDIEKLPFPMAPLGASGVMALSENQMGKEGWRWRCFSIGTAFGLIFGFLYYGIPVLSTALGMSEPLMLLPLPWLETSVKTETVLKAMPTGLSLDMANFFVGMALPFFGVLGACIALVVTCVANPLLVHFKVLTSWKPGMQTVEILFNNSVDFYLSFGLGLALAVALIGAYQCFSSLKQAKERGFDAAVATATPVKVVKTGRGDIRTWLVIVTYLCSSTFYICLCGWLLDWDFRGSYLLPILLFFAFVYTPVVSYVTARLEGLVGGAFDLPFIREAAFIFSQFKGIEIWLLPIPLRNFGGGDTSNYRISELLGCSFRSIWKMTAVTVPLVFLLSLLYGQFIWSLGPIPGPQYPYAQALWELNARQQCLVLSSTVTGFSPFMEALKPAYIAAGGILGLSIYSGLAAFGLPILLLFGVVKGLGGSIPQSLITQFAGALFGRYVMAPRFGEERWRNYAPVLFAGYACGAGLVMMFASGVRFLSASVFQLAY